MQLKKAWDSFRSGEPLSDQELQMLLIFTKDLEKSLKIIGENGGVLFKLRMDICYLESIEFHRTFNKEKKYEA